MERPSFLLNAVNKLQTAFSFNGPTGSEWNSLVKTQRVENIRILNAVTKPQNANME